MSTLFSGHYLRNRSTLDIGVLGYIGIVQHKAHSPAVLSIPPVTPCIHISDCLKTAYELPLLPNNTAVKHVYTNRSIAMCSLDIYRWGAGLEVTGRIRDIGQKVLESSL